MWDARGLGVSRCGTGVVFNWNDVRVLLEVSRAETVSEAAKRLGVDNSTVSRRIQTLERSLETALFERKSGRLVLTADGKRIVEHAERMERAAGDIEHATRSDGTPAAGRVRIATTRTMATEIVYPVAEQIVKLHPNVIPEVDAHVQRIDIMKGEAELALTCYEPTHPRLVHRHVFTALGAIYGSRDYLEGRPPATLESIDGHDVIGIAEVNATTAAGPWFEKNIHGGAIVVRSSSAEEMLRLCVAGRGLALLFCFRADEQPNLVRVPDLPLIRLQHWLVVHPDLQHVPRVRIVMDELVARIAAVRDKLENLRELDKPKLEIVRGSANPNGEPA